MLEHSKTTKAAKAPLQPQLSPQPAAPTLSPAEQQAVAVQRFALRPTAVQRVAAKPVLSAIKLQRQEEQRLSEQIQPLQRQMAESSAGLPAGAVQSALQRQVEKNAPIQAPAKPQSVGDWVTVMRAHAQGVEHKNSTVGLSSREVATLSTLQRQTAQVLAQSVKTDPRPAVQRQASFAEHAAPLHGHPLTHNIPRAAIGFAVPSERAGLQRALDEALQRQAEQQSQDAQALQLHSLQRQMAELDAQATQPVYERIQQRRGAGNPLPEAIQRHLEHGLNHDLSAVRIHDDAEADKLSKKVNAVAFTTGTDIYFQSGKFNPNSQSGLELLAHEVTHTVQQSKGQVGKGIDPDAGLESEARMMGRKLSQTHKKGPVGHGPKFGHKVGSHTSPRPSLRQAVSAGPAGIQRWGLGDLKKLASKATSAVSSKVNSVKQAAQKAVQNTVKKVQSIAKPVIKAAQKTAQKAKAAVQRTVQKAKAKIQTVSKTVKQYAATKLKALKQKGQQAIAKAKKTAASLKQKATQLAQRASKTYKQVKNSAQKVAANVGQKVKQGLDTAKKKAGQAFDSAKNYVQKTAKDGLEKAKGAAQALSRRTQAALNTAKMTAKSVGQSMIKGLKSAKAAAGKAALKAGKATTGVLSKAVAAIKKFPKARPLSALAMAGGSLYAGYKAVQSIRKGGLKGLANDIKNTAAKTVNWLKSPEGLATITRVGITAAVTIGAAALTVGTGGLAAPLAIAASAAIMGAGGAVGGMAGKLAQNAILKNVGSAQNRQKYAGLSYTEGINVRSVAGDFALGAALGPAGALVGGVARQVVGNVGRYAAAPAARLLGSAGRSMVNGIKGLRGVGVSASRQGIGRSASDTLRTTRSTSTLRQQLSLQVKDMRAYNSQLWAETRKDVTQSMYGSLGMGGKVRNPAEVLGGAKQLRTAQLRVARDRVTAMEHREVTKLARDLRLPSNLPINQLRSKVTAGLVRTNHPLVAKAIQSQVRRRVQGQVLSEVKEQFFGVPKKAGESVARRYVRGAGNLATAGFRTNLRNIRERDHEVAAQFAQGRLNGVAQFSGATAGEITKMNLMSLMRTGNILSDPAGKQLLEGAVQASGGTPDMYKERAAGSWFGFDSAPKSVTNRVGGGSVDAGLQFEDTPEVQEAAH